MSLTPSNMLELGTIAPDFCLPDTISNKKISLTDIRSDIATVIIFMCNHCPYVKHIQSKLVKVANKYQSNGINFLAINANDIMKYPDDSPEKMKLEAQIANYTFPYLFDETQSVAKAYKAACTPDFYVFDKDLACVYRGRFDDSTPGNDKPITGKDLCEALNAILDNKPISQNQLPSIGCNIKWK